MHNSESVVRGGNGRWTAKPVAYTVTPMIFQPVTALNLQQLVAIAAGAGQNVHDVYAAIEAEQLQVYRIGTILVAVCKVDDKLLMEAVIQEGRPGGYMRDMTANLVRLARQWGCYALETTTSDRNIANLIKLIGGRVTEQTLLMEI